MSLGTFTDRRDVPGGDILHHPNPEQRLAPLVAHEGHGQVPPNQTAVFSVVALFNVIVLSFATDHFGEHVSIPLHIIRVRALRKWHVAELLRTVGR